VEPPHQLLLSPHTAQYPSPNHCSEERAVFKPSLRPEVSFLYSRCNTTTTNGRARPARPGCPSLPPSAPDLFPRAQTSLWPHHQETGRRSQRAERLELSAEQRVDPDLLSTAWPDGQWREGSRATGPVLAGPRQFRASTWPAPCSYRELPRSTSTRGAAPLLLLARGLNILSRLLHLQPAPWQWERCPTGTRREPASSHSHQPQGEGGDGWGGQARLVLHSFCIHCSSARCPSVLATAGPCVPQHAHPTAEGTPIPPGRRRVRERQQQTEEAQPRHFLRFANLHHAAANPGPGHGPTASPTRRDGQALPGRARSRGQVCSPSRQARRSQSQLNGVFSYSHDSKWLWLQRKARSVWPC